jgi:hypothetical protein
MNLFDALLVGHLVGDFLFQTAWMARYKHSQWAPLLAHVAAYTLIVTVAGLWCGGLSLWAVALIFVTHLLIDRGRIVKWWARTIQGVARREDAWILIVTDQVFHIVVLATAVWISAQWPTPLGGL